jgi:hypothetical protein
VYLKANWLMRLVVQTQYQQGKGYSTVKWLDKFYWQIRWTCIIGRDFPTIQLKIPSSAMFFHLKEVGLPVTGLDPTWNAS